MKRRRRTTNFLILVMLCMLPYENEVAAYIEETGNHVLYEVVPVFKDGGAQQGESALFAGGIDSPGVCALRGM